MWVTERNGRYQYRERYKNPLTEKSFIVSCTMPKDTAHYRKLAQDVLARKRDERLGSVAAMEGKDSLRLCDLVELYRAEQRRTVKATTYDRNFYACKSIMGIIGRDVKVNKLTAGYVKERFNQSDESNGTINERIKRFKALMRWGYTNDYVDSIEWLEKVCALPDDQRRARIETKFFERQELQKLLDSMSIDSWRYLTSLCALSGLRVGEAIALKKKNVDFKNKVIHVEETYDYRHDLNTTPKTSTSNRDVFMQPELYALCKDIQKAMLKQSSGSGCNSVYFLSSVDGSPLEYFSFNKYLKKKSQSVLGKHATTHILRHTHVALLAEQGIQLDVIARRLGHSRSDVTRDVYMHVTSELKERDNQKLTAVKIL